MSSSPSTSADAHQGAAAMPTLAATDTAARYDAAALRAYAVELLMRIGRARRHRRRRRRRAGRRRPDGTHDARARAARRLSRPARAGANGQGGRTGIVHAATAAQTWDGQRLPGPGSRCARSMPRSRWPGMHGTGTVVIRRSHHIACLAAYLKRATDRGVMALIHCSDPSNHSVAPFGAVTSVFTPNPLAAGIPTSGDPILIDVSASYTTNGMTSRLHKAGETLAHPWVQDARRQCDARSGRAVSRAEGHAAAARRSRSRPQGLRRSRSSSKR